MSKPCIWCGYSSYPSKKGKRKCGACDRTLTSRDIKRGEIVKILCEMEWDALYCWSVAGWPFREKFHNKGIPYLTEFADKILDQITSNKKGANP